MSDFISNMTESEMRGACEKVIESGPCDIHSLNGLILEKIIKWGCSFSYINGWNIYYDDGFVWRKILLEAFLCTADALGHWIPAHTKEELVYLRGKDGKVMIWTSEGYPLEEYIKFGGWERVTVTPYKENL